MRPRCENTIEDDVQLPSRVRSEKHPDPLLTSPGTQGLSNIGIRRTAGLVLEIAHDAVLIFAPVCPVLSRLQCCRRSEDVGGGGQPDGLGDPPLAFRVGEALRHFGVEMEFWLALSLEEEYSGMVGTEGGGLILVARKEHLGLLRHWTFLVVTRSM
ncbi:hypothetical protein BDW74DRAFT_142937 [Aspergillus multicolor]|uniref:uncharacterized protein n=1 Tax=Aspergillus multicolor TaxID=41759 RepID=UPI003CCD76B7